MNKAKYIVANAKKIKEVFISHKLNSPQLIISSPPYFDLLNYNDNKEQIGYGQKNYDEYLNDVCEVFQSCYDLAKPNATFWLVIDTFKKSGEVKLLPFDIVNRLKEKNKKTWILKDMIIWDKGKNLPWTTKGNFRNQFEHILFFTKGDDFIFKIDPVRQVIDLKKWWKTYPERYNPKGKAPSNIWNFNAPLRGWGDGKQNHLCPFPFELIERIISISSNENDWILDPFAGSGSTLALANQMKRNSIGLDINREYFKRFNKEVKIGAKKFWLKREIEIEEGKKILANFKTTNKNLRKLKVASHICEHINEINKHSFTYFTRQLKDNNVEVFVIQNGIKPLIKIKDEELKSLIKQSKVNPIITIVKDKEFIKANTPQKVYKYQFKKFFSYTSTCKFKTILSDEKRHDFIYSDIGIKLGNN